MQILAYILRFGLAAVSFDVSFSLDGKLCLLRMPVLYSSTVPRLATAAGSGEIYRGRCNVQQCIVMKGGCLIVVMTRPWQYRGRILKLWCLQRSRLRMCRLRVLFDNKAADSGQHGTKHGLIILMMMCDIISVTR